MLNNYCKNTNIFLILQSGVCKNAIFLCFLAKKMSV